MDTILEILRGSDTLIMVWRGIILLFVAYLTGVGLLMLLRRDLALKFLAGHASTVFFNTLEAVLRALVGIAAMGAAPDTRFPVAVFYIGVILVVTAAFMLVLPGLHKRYGEWAMGLLKPTVLPFYGIVAILLGILVLYTVHWGGFTGH